MEFTCHRIGTAPAASKPLLEKSLSRYKFVPNLHAVMAESPQLLEAYQSVADLYAKTALSVLERQVVLMAINYENDCHYCMAAHSAIATMEKMPADILEALRKGTPLADPKLQALRAFAATMTVTRGWPDAAALTAVREAGYDKRAILDVILALGYKVMSNYVNHLAETDLDAGFQPFVWSKEQQAAE